MAMQFLSTGTHVLIADGAKALVLRNAGDAHAPRLECLEHHAIDNPPNREQAADAPGVIDGPGHAPRAAMEQTDYRARASEAFLRGLLRDLEGRAQAGDLDRLVIAAPPAQLGVLRSAMGPGLARCLIAALPKGLAAHPLPDITRIIAQDLQAA